MCRQPPRENYRSVINAAGPEINGHRHAPVPADAPADVETLRREVAELRQALESRTVIGQATGMLMERYKLDGDRAFKVLVRISRQSNVKVRDVAAAMTADVAGPGATPEKFLAEAD